MKGYVINIEERTQANPHFREVLYTAHYSQLVVMSLVSGEDIGEEVHGVDQFIRIESGTGTAIIDGVSHAIADGSAIVIPAGARHNIINTSEVPMKLYSIYSTPHHADKTVHPTKTDALASHEEFTGDTTE